MWRAAAGVAVQGLRQTSVFPAPGRPKSCGLGGGMVETGPRITPVTGIRDGERGGGGAIVPLCLREGDPGLGGEPAGAKKCDANLQRPAPNRPVVS